MILTITKNMTFGGTIEHLSFVSARSYWLETVASLPVHRAGELGLRAPAQNAILQGIGAEQLGQGTTTGQWQMSLLRLCLRLALGLTIV